MTLDSTKNSCLLYVKLIACVFVLSWTANSYAQQEDPQGTSAESDAVDTAKTEQEEEEKTADEEESQATEPQPAKAVEKKPIKTQEKTPPKTVVAKPVEEPKVDQPFATEEIVITGSLIPRTNVTAPNPVTSISSDDIQYGGSLFLNDVITKIPQLQPSMTAATSTQFIGTAGIATLNLRGLGSGRTLVLVNGRRHVGSSSLSPTMDINTIPQDLIKRVEILTGGASSTYGSDAVAGVVNFVLRDHFEGIVVRGDYGGSGHGDAGSWFTTLTAGTDFADGRGNAVISMEFSHRDVLRTADRSFSATNRRWLANPDDGDAADANGDWVNDGIPDQKLYDNAGLSFINRNGVMFALSPYAITFNDDGSARAFDYGERFPGNAQVGGDYLHLAGLGDLWPRMDRYMALALVTYNLVEDYAQIYSEAKFVLTESQGRGSGQPSFDFNSGDLMIHRDNAFLPTYLASFYDANGIESWEMWRFNMDLGQRDEETDRLTLRSVLGVRGDINENLSYDVGFTWGRTNITSRALNNRVNARFFAATDAVVDYNGEVGAPGEIVCRVNLQKARGETATLPDGSPAPDYALQDNSGRCVPISLFGEGVSTEAQRFINQSSALRNTIEQMQFMGYLTANSMDYFELPGGPLALVLGGEFRRDQATEMADLGDGLGLTFFNAFSPSDGKIDLAELFAEVQLPILNDLPGVHELTASAGGRISDYSLPQVGTIAVWQANLLYSPVEDVTLRGSYSLAVRAPNVGEAFGGASQNYFAVNDPCDDENVNNGSADRPDRCRELAEEVGFAGYEPGTTSIPDESTREGLSAGNPDLSEETSKSWTLGTVITPRWVPGLSISADFYNFRIEDAIASPGAQRILENCVDFDSINNKFCELITRSPTNMEITLIKDTQVNLAALETRGIDFEIYQTLKISWLADVFGAKIGDWGQLNLKLNGNRLLTWVNYPDQTNSKEKQTYQGFSTTPKWRWSFSASYMLMDFTFTYNVVYQGMYSRSAYKENFDENPDYRDPADAEAKAYHGIQARYRILDTIEVYAGINNLLDNEPPRGFDGTATGFYDPIGRYFYGGAKVTY